MTKRKSKGAYMISAVAEMYGIHPQTLRLYEREGLLKPSRTEGNTRLYTDEDLQRLEFILTLARDLAVNISGIAIILQMRERMEEMQRQIQDFVKYMQQEVLNRATAAADPSKGAIVPLRRPVVVPAPPGAKREETVGSVSFRALMHSSLAYRLRGGIGAEVSERRFQIGASRGRREPGTPCEGLDLSLIRFSPQTYLL